MTHAQAHQTLHRFALIGYGFENFCLTPGPGIRVNYPSAKLLRSAPRSVEVRVHSGA
jgi:hypothetical protein